MGCVEGASWAVLGPSWPVLGLVVEAGTRREGGRGGREKVRNGGRTGSREEPHGGKGHGRVGKAL